MKAGRPTRFEYEYEYERNRNIRRLLRVQMSIAAAGKWSLALGIKR
jgi:hypothetical protein